MHEEWKKFDFISNKYYYTTGSGLNKKNRIIQIIKIFINNPKRFFFLLHLKFITIVRNLNIFREYNSVKNVSEYLGISRYEVLKKAKIKDTKKEDIIWNEINRTTKNDYRDYYSKNVHYLERQDWYNRNEKLDFLQNIKNNGVMLDYGCGTGFIAFKAKQKRPDIHICLADIPQALTKEFALWRFKKHEYNFHWYDIPNNEIIEYQEKFDFIRCHDVFEHTFHPDVIMQNFYKYLKSGGLLSFDFMEDDKLYHKEKTEQSMLLREKTFKFVANNFNVIDPKHKFIKNWLVSKP